MYPKYDLLLIEKEGKRYCVLIKSFNTFMYDHTLHSERKHFCGYCLQVFSTAEILKSHVKDCFKINDKQKIKMPKKCYESEQVNHTYFESILLPENNEIKKKG